MVPNAIGARREAQSRLTLAMAMQAPCADSLLRRCLNRLVQERCAGSPRSIVPHLEPLGEGRSVQAAAPV